MYSFQYKHAACCTNLKGGWYTQTNLQSPIYFMESACNRVQDPAGNCRVLGGTERYWGGTERYCKAPSTLQYAFFVLNDNNAKLELS